MRTRSSRLSGSLIVTFLACTACETPINERLLEIEVNGAVRVFLFRDDNINGTYDGTADTPVSNGPFALRMLGAAEDTQTGRTDSAGVSLALVPAGRYTLSVDDAVLGDSLEVLAGGGEFTIATTDTVRQNVAVAYRIVSAAEARATAIGKRVWLVGTALNAPSSFGDSTVHVTDGQVAIRALNVRPAGIVAGDSVAFLGRILQVAGQPAIDVSSQILRGLPVAVSPDSVTTAAAAAASAGGGPLDARLVRIFDAVIGDTATDPSGNRVLTVDDGSGPLDVVLSRNLNWAPINQFGIGAKLEGTGVLVPSPGQLTEWVLKPRTRSDLLVF